MKLIHALNCILMGLTLLLFGLSALFFDVFFGAAIWLTIMLALYQVVLGFFMYLFRLANLWLLGYLLGVALFFFMIGHDIIDNLWIMPSILACYFSYIAYGEAKKSES